jgi:CRP/FNR family transcriptional regulator
LPNEALTKFLALAQVRVYSADVIFIHQGDEDAGVFVVRSGLVKLFYNTPGGKIITAGVYGPGTIIGLKEVLLESAYELNAVALKQTEVEYIQRPDFTVILQNNPRLAIALLTKLSLEAQETAAQLLAVSGALPLAARLMHKLEQLASICSHPTSGGIKIDLPLTVQELADMLGCSRQWASKLLKDLEEVGMISRRGASITLTLRELPASKAASGSPR